MKRYSEYKDSGVKWIGEIPGHWNCCKLKYFTRIKSGDALTNNALSDTGKYKVYGGGDFMGFYDKYNVDANTILIGRVGARCGCVTITEEKAWATDNALILIHFNINTKFLTYLLVAANLNSLSISNAQPLITGSKVKDSFIPIPLIEEQEAIVTYLDSKVAKIDEYISLAEKKIAALEELKQTIIAEAVTRGIHKDVPMKDSGVKWIGMIPEHWDLLRAKNIFERQFRTVRDCDEVVTCFRDGQVTLRKNRRIEGFTESLKEIGYQGIRKGDLVIHQMDAFAGSIGVSDSDGKGTPVYICCLPKDSKNVNVYFYAYLLREMARSGFIKSLYRGIRERSSDFRFDTFAVQWLPLVPIEEQQEIVNYIEAKVANINQLCQAERSQIEKLKEYKQRLISDVVTGKVKVTND